MTTFDTSKMSKIFFIVIMISLSACGTKPISKQVRNDFTLRFEDRDTGLQQRIRIDGYYSKKDTTYIDNKGDVNMIFFADGTFSYNFHIRGKFSNNPETFFSESFDFDSLDNFGVSFWGLYQINGDSIITQVINRASWMAPWVGMEMRYIIINSETIKAISSQPIGFEVSQELLERRWHDQSRFTPARFVPTDTLPPSDNWLKGEKWLWRNEKDWQDYMKRKSGRK